MAYSAALAKACLKEASSTLLAARRGSPDPAENVDRRSPVQLWRRKQKVNLPGFPLSRE